jgi:hypothetical protein
MTTKRIEILAKILEEEKLFKLAQEAGANMGEVDKTTADRLAEEIAAKLIQDELDRLLG